MFNKNKDNKTNPMLSDFIRVYPDSKKNRNIYIRSRELNYK